MKTAVRPAAPAAAAAALAAKAAPAATARLGWLPLVLSLLVCSTLLLERVQRTAGLFGACAGVGGGLLLWQLGLWLRSKRTGRALAVEVVPPIRQHFVQASVQTCLYLFWGWWWVQDGVRPIYAQAPLILAQFAFLYAFDALFAWSRGRTWRLTSGPVPIVLSTNLFIWFRDEWFGWQFAMVAAGLLGKEFLKWTKDGRRTHVFNPSGFGLACAATVLIATDTTDLTWARELATTIQAVPGIFVFLFVLGLVVQSVFHVTLMTFAAALAMVACNLGYHEGTGVWLFASSNLPAAAFLGLHLLMTDPSTSPRSNVGRVLFGLGYGFGYVVVFQVLGQLGAPDLYAKLYPVPILNCCVQWLDRFARGPAGALENRWQNVLPKAATNAIHMAAWSAVFVVMLATGYLQGPHPGDSIEFWKQAVVEGRHEAARKLVMVAGSKAVGGGSADAYNELGLLSLGLDVDDASAVSRHNSAGDWFARAAARGSVHAHENIVLHFLYHGRHRSDADLDRSLRALEQRVAAGEGGRAAQLLGLVHETGAGRPQDLRRALDLYRRTGDDARARNGIVRLGLLPGALVDLAPLAPALAAAAAEGDGESAYHLAAMHRAGRGVPADAAQAKALLARAAELGFDPARQVLQEPAAADGLPSLPPPRRRALTPPPWSTAFPLPR